MDLNFPPLQSAKPIETESSTKIALKCYFIEINLVKSKFVCKFVCDSHNIHILAYMEKYKFGIKFRLEQRKDGNGNIIVVDVPILADITFNGKRVFYFTGYRIDANKWIDQKTPDGMRVQQAKKGCNNKRGESAAEINARLRRIVLAVENVFKRLEVDEIPPTTNNVRDYLKKELDEESMSRRKLVEYYQEFIDEQSVAATWSKGTKTKHKTMIRHLQDFKRELYFEDVNENLLNAFVQFLITTKGLSNPYVAKSIMDIKTFLNWATRKGYNKVFDYKQFKLKLKGVAASEKNNTFALTMNEFEHLMTMKIERESLRITRDVFCFCCLTSLRYSDARHLKWADIKDDGKGNKTIAIVTIKTDDPLLIPLNAPALSIVERYKDCKTDDNSTVLPIISNQKYNEHLKELGELAGFDEPYKTVKYQGAQRIEEITPKHKLMTSHVARRTFVTLALSFGMPGELVKACTGHHSDKMMRGYERFNLQDKQRAMNLLNFNKVGDETVFDYNITDEERKQLNIPGIDEYKKSIEQEPGINFLHLACLFFLRKDAAKTGEYMQKLTPERMQVVISWTMTHQK